MKKILFLISLCAWIVACSDSPSDGSKEPEQPIEYSDSLYVSILHYNGTDKIYELAAYQDSYIFNGELGDGDHYTIERNFYIDTVVFDVSPRFHQCKDSSSLTYKIDGKKVETVESKWGRQALPLPDEEKHTVEISAASTCNQMAVTFDIVPSEKPGKIFKHIDRFYLSFFPRIDSYPYKNGSLFLTITPAVAPQYFEGDTTLSRCKLMSGEDSLMIPVTFDKYKKRLGTIAHINADSVTLTSFTDAHKDFSLACALYYQSWKVPAKVDSVQYFQAFPVSFRKTFEAPYIGEHDGKIDIFRESNLLPYLIIMRAHKRGTKEFVHNINYDYIHDTISVGTSWFLPQNSDGNPVDIDSIYAYVLPYILATPESYELWDYLYSKYGMSCLDGKWCDEDAGMKKDFDTTLAKLFTKHDGMDPHTWMSAFAWERTIPLTRADTVGFKGEKLEMTDERDGQKYKYVPIGGHYWMAENLNYKSDSSTCYMDSAKYCDTYGRYYPFSEIESVCPKGWRIPVKQDFDTLMLHAGEDTVRSTSYFKANTKLMSVTEWQTDVGEDEFGFSAYPYGESDGGAGFRAAYWTKSGVYGGYVYVFQILAGYSEKPRIIFDSEVKELRNGRQLKRSIRCISDSTYELSSSSVPFSSSSIQYSTLTDERDNQTYKTVVIGNQEWMAENLNFETDSSWCYDTIPENCEKYGRLYQWHAVVDRSYAECGMRHECTVEEPAQGICPSGWHVPSAAEWDMLVAYTGMRTGGKEGSGRTLKSEDGWDGWTGLNRLGFNALPAGSRAYHAPIFSSLYEFTAFWTSTAEEYGMTAQHYVFSYKSHDVLGWSEYKDAAFSLRCVKNKE